MFNASGSSANTFKTYVGETTLKVSLALKEATERKKSIIARVNGELLTIPYTEKKRQDLLYTLSDNIYLSEICRKSKTILFSSEQASVFLNLRKTYFESLDFRLPFEYVFLMFDHPLSIDYTLRFVNDFNRGELLAIGITQKEYSQSRWEAESIKGKQETGAWQPVFPNENENVLINTAVFLYKDWGIEHYGWQSDASANSLLSNTDETRTSAMNIWRSLAVACIGYINCENVYLEEVGVIPEKVNRKREKKGKSRLEPYYICRIRNAKGETVETGNGTQHGIRYDVRGHFRKLESGKTTWVRPHQRGLINELYVPKVYAVGKGAKE